MKRLAWMIVLTFALLPASMASACPTCKDAIPSTDSENPNLVPGGINASIFYMLGGLLVSIGLVATVITKGVTSTNARMVKMTNDQTRLPNE